jgi:hypothetical protein
MQVRVGPVAAGGVRLWVAYARTVLAQALAHLDAMVVGVPADVVETLEGFLDTWDDLARDGLEVTWVADVNRDALERVAHVWFAMAEWLAAQAERRGFPLSPPEGEEFYQALVAELLGALDREGRSLVDTAEGLQQQWPGLKLPDANDPTATT